MKKRRMKLIALTLTVAMTMSMAAPTMAAEGTGQSVAGVETTGREDQQSDLSVDKAEETKTEEKTENSETANSGNETADTEESETATSENTGTEEQNLILPQAEAAEPQASTQIPTGESWTLEKIYNDAEELIAIAFREFSDDELTTLDVKWVFDMSTKKWAMYISDDETATAQAITAGKNQVGYYNGKELYYNLNVDGTAQAGSWLVEDGKYTFYLDEKTAQTLSDYNAAYADLYLGLACDPTLVQGLHDDIETGVFYYLNADGSLLKNASKTIDGIEYKFDADGKCIFKAKWVKVDGKWKYFTTAGKYAKSEWIEYKGKKYYIGSDEYMLVGWQKIDGKWYFLEKAAGGAAKTGWIKLKTKWYYFKPDTCEMVSDWYTVYGKSYYFGSAEDGAMKSGWLKLDGKWYYLGNDGSLKTGWQKPASKWYYLNPEENGAMVTGWNEISGVTYYFKSSGAMVTAWQKINDKWYYFAKGGALRSGWQTIGTKKYYLDPENGKAMASGWLKLDGKWYYLGSADSGAMKTGWVKVGSKWYYLDENGVMQTGWKKLNGKWYYLNSSGSMKTGFLELNGSTYYLKSNGVMATGITVIDGAAYVFASGGAMKKNCNYSWNGTSFTLGSDGKVQGGAAKTIMSAYNKLNQVGWSLRSAYNWSASLPYYRMQNYGIGPASGDVHSLWYADYGYAHSTGNCYVMASTFCYMARLLGYETYYVEGQVPLAKGGMGPHAWCEVVINGSTYVFDPNFTNETGRNGYQINYGMSGTWRYSNYHRVS